MNPNPDFGKRGDGAAHINRIPAEAVELRDHKNITGFESIKKAGEAGALGDGNASRYRFGDDPARLNRETRSLNLQNLIIGGLAGG